MHEIEAGFWITDLTDYADDTDLSRSKGICQLSESGFSGFGDVQDVISRLEIAVQWSDVYTDVIVWTVKVWGNELREIEPFVWITDLTDYTDDTDDWPGIINSYRF